MEFMGLQSLGYAQKVLGTVQEFTKYYKRAPNVPMIAG